MSPTFAQAAVPLQAPFPGLRAFEAEESLLFYGREAHTAELLDRLGDSRFVAVVGTSGSGKSSLVRAGLRPALQRGYLVGATSRWRFATMRPGTAPLEALAAALATVLDRVPIEEIRTALRATSSGLSEVVLRASLARGESLLIIADQFEELFRFDVTREQQGEAALFVSHLLEASERHDASIYAVVTMRSEFLGRCSEFNGLAEAFNRSQYLVPRLTLEERRQTIENPLRLFGTEPSPALVQQVLNDVGDDPDQLPVMQHALLRTFRAWERSGASGRIERHHYDDIGRIEHALDRHGEEILSQLDEAARRTTERLFRSLTVTQGGVALRRPRRLERLYRVTGAEDAQARHDVDRVIQLFSDRQNAFLILSASDLGPGTVIDIIHESVARRWRRLGAWVREESRSAEWYADLARDVLRYRSRSVSLWQDPELAGVRQRQRQEGWNAAWADQYRSGEDAPFAEVSAFLDDSTRAQEERVRVAEDQRNRDLQQALRLARAKRWQAIILALLLVVLGIAAFIQYLRDRDAARAANLYEQAIAENRGVSDRAAQLEAELARLKEAPVTPENRARQDEVAKQLNATNAELRQSQDELANLRKNQELNTSDRGRLLSQIESLQAKLATVTAERDRLANQFGSPATAQDVTREFIAGVRAYESDDWKLTTQHMQNAIMMQATAPPPPKEVRLYGTRFVPLSPNVYLAAALNEMQTDCARIREVLRRAAIETVPPYARARLQAARTRCEAP